MSTFSDKLEAWETDLINGYLAVGGKFVSEDHYKQRRSICEGCPRFGKVRLPFVETMGCLECGCPVSTKPRVYKYFNPLRLRVVTVECPLGKWADIDNLFNNEIED